MTGDPHPAPQAIAKHDQLTGNRYDTTTNVTPTNDPQSVVTITVLTTTKTKHRRNNVSTMISWTAITLPTVKVHRTIGATRPITVNIGE